MAKVPEQVASGVYRVDVGPYPNAISVLLIADEDGPTSIAGLMGGERSEVRASTTRVLMEAANWNGPNLQRTSNKLNLRT